MIPFYRCDDSHDEVRWSWVDGRHCWMCNKLGRGCVAMSITATDDFIRELDDTLMPGPK